MACVLCTLERKLVTCSLNEEKGAGQLLTFSSISRETGVWGEKNNSHDDVSILPVMSSRFRLFLLRLGLPY